LGDSTETLIYNFGMQLGDSVNIKFNDSVQAFYGREFQTGSYTLDDTSMVMTAAGMRKVFSLNCHQCNNSHTLYWIEGIGCLADVIYPYSGNTINSCSYNELGGAFPYNLSYFIVCFEHNYKAYFDSSAFQFALSNAAFYYEWGNHWQVTDSCDFAGGWGGIKDISSMAKFKIVPLPATDKIIIKMNIVQGATYDIYIRDIEGKEVGPHISLGFMNSGAYDKQVNVEDLNSGLYIIECRSPMESTYSKLVIQR